MPNLIFQLKTANLNSIAGSSNGRIVASEAIHLGSSPSPAANYDE